MSEEDKEEINNQDHYSFRSPQKKITTITTDKVLLINEEVQEVVEEKEIKDEMDKKEEMARFLPFTKVSTRRVNSPRKPKDEKNDIDFAHEIKKRIIFGTGISIITMITQFLPRTVNLVFLGREASLTDFKAIQIAYILVYIFGDDFALGGLQAFENLGIRAFVNKDFDMLYKIYNECKIFTILVYILLILPLCFPTDIILFYLGIDAEVTERANSFIRLLLIPILLLELSRVNVKFLEIIGYNFIGMTLNILALIVHIMASTVFIYSLQMGIIGAVISSIISSLSLFVLTCYFVELYNPCEHRVLYIVDTDSLNSSKFYLFMKQSVRNGILYTMKHITILTCLFFSYYFGEESLCSSIIVFNYLSMMYFFIMGFNNFLHMNLIKSISISLRKQIYTLKVTVYFAAALTITISFLNFIFKNWICNFYIPGNENICLNVNFILTIYSLFIFADYGYNIILTVLKVINKSGNLEIIISLLSFLLFQPLGLIVAFSLGFGILGFWYIVFLSMLVYLIIELSYLFTLNIEKEVNQAVKDLANLLDEEAIN
jgi:Na+-driven multidrug efflux pump